jgi:succinyl-CoA synthetase beta subunit
MRLYEYQSKMILAKYGIPIPRGRVTSTASEARQIADDLGGRVVVKSQVLTSGRGTVGGILLAKNSRRAQQLVTRLLDMEIKGFPVRRVLVDEAVQIADAWYVAIRIDRKLRVPVLLASSLKDNSNGNENIEEELMSLPINPLLGIKDYQIRDIAASIGLPAKHWKQFIKVVHGLWHAFLRMDATLVEIKPLVVTEDARMLALDALMIVDDNASFRHPEFSEYWDLGVAPQSEVEARKHGLQYVKLKGNIGCMVNGAGLMMSIMDLIDQFGGSPANFLDVGGGATPEKVAAGFRLLLTDENVQAILVNIFGGLTYCDDVADGILIALQERQTRVPIVIRMEGTNAGEGRRKLEDAHLVIADTLIDAVQKAIAFSNGGWNGNPD